MSKIWVDADACPVAIKQIIFRNAQRTQTLATFVSNHPISTPNSKFIQRLQVAQGFDVADNEIVMRCEKGDLIITSDIPLASEVIDKGCLALSPRGELFTKENIRSRLNIRDFMDTLRSSGIQTGGPSALSASEKQSFGNELDKWSAQRQAN